MKLKSQNSLFSEKQKSKWIFHPSSVWLSHIVLFCFCHHHLFSLSSFAVTLSMQRILMLFAQLQSFYFEIRSFILILLAYVARIVDTATRCSGCSHHSMPYARPFFIFSMALNHRLSIELKLLATSTFCILCSSTVATVETIDKVIVRRTLIDFMYESILWFRLFSCSRVYVLLQFSSESNRRSCATFIRFPCAQTQIVAQIYSQKLSVLCVCVCSRAVMQTKNNSELLCGAHTHNKRTKTIKWPIINGKWWLFTRKMASVILSIVHFRLPQSMRSLWDQTRSHTHTLPLPAPFVWLFICYFCANNSNHTQRRFDFPIILLHISAR